MSQTFTLTHRVKAESSQKAVALRDQLTKMIEADEDVTLESASSAEATRNYVVQAVDTDSKEVINRTVEAPTPDAAAAQVADDTTVVVGSPEPV